MSKPARVTLPPGPDFDPEALACEQYLRALEDAKDYDWSAKEIIHGARLFVTGGGR